MEKAKAKERMKQGGGDKKSAAAKSGSDKSPDPINTGKAADKAGEAAGVSGKTVEPQSGP